LEENRKRGENLPPFTFQDCREKFTAWRGGRDLPKKRSTSFPKKDNSNNWLIGILFRRKRRGKAVKEWGIKETDYRNKPRGVRDPT